MNADNRPRVAYILPNGTTANVIFDHGQVAPDEVSFTLAGGEVVMIQRADIVAAKQAANRAAATLANYDLTDDNSDDPPTYRERNDQ